MFGKLSKDSVDYVPSNIRVNSPFRYLSSLDTKSPIYNIAEYLVSSGKVDEISNFLSILEPSQSKNLIFYSIHLAMSMDAIDIIETMLEDCRISKYIDPKDLLISAIRNKSEKGFLLCKLKCSKTMLEELLVKDPESVLSCKFNKRYIDTLLPHSSQVSVILHTRLRSST